MNTDIFHQENLSSLFISVNVADAQQKSEVLPNILQKLGLSVQAQVPSRLDQDLQLITAVRIIIVAFHQASVDLSIGEISNSFEDDNNGAKEFLFLIEDPEVDVSIGDVVEGESFGIEIISDASHLHCEFCISGASVGI